jgi:hypothetical protein
MYSESIKAMVYAVRLLLARPRVFVLLVTAYAGLLGAVYLFVSTREATISQLILTLIVVVAAPALFFVLQAVLVSYVNGSMSGSKQITFDCLKLMIVSLPVIVLTILAVWGLSKVQTHLTIVTTLRYLLIAVIAPLLAIQLWIAAGKSDLRSLVKNLRTVLTGTLAPQSVFVYACGFLIFAIVPHFLVQESIPVQRAWLEFSLLIVRLAIAAALILLGWVTTVGAISLTSRN